MKGLGYLLLFIFLLLFPIGCGIEEKTGTSSAVNDYKEFKSTEGYSFKYPAMWDIVTKDFVQETKTGKTIQFNWQVTSEEELDNWVKSEITRKLSAEEADNTLVEKTSSKNKNGILTHSYIIESKMNGSKTLLRTTIIFDGSLRYEFSAQSPPVLDKEYKQIIDSFHVPSKVSNIDIKDAKSVVAKHFEALTQGDLSGFKNTLGKYKKGFADQEHIKQELLKPKRYIVKNISFPGKYVHNGTPGSYKSNFHKDPYKVIVLNVLFYKYNSQNTFEQINWDYIIVKETVKSPWLIHDWGV